MASPPDDDFSASIAWDTNPSTSHSISPSPSQPTPTTSTNHSSDPYSAYDQHPTTSTQHDHHSDGHPTTTTGDQEGAGQAIRNVQVKDSKVELEGTNDTFVSYLVCAQVRLFPFFFLPLPPLTPRFRADRPPELLVPYSLGPETFPRLCLPPRCAHEGLPGVRRAAFARETSHGCALFLPASDSPSAGLHQGES